MVCHEVVGPTVHVHSRSGSRKVISSLDGRELAVDVAWKRGLIMEVGERLRCNELWLLNELLLETSEMIWLSDEGIRQVLAFEDLEVRVWLIEGRELWRKLVELMIVRQRVDVVWLELTVLNEIVAAWLFV